MKVFIYIYIIDCEINEDAFSVIVKSINLLPELKKLNLKHSLIYDDMIEDTKKIKPNKLEVCELTFAEDISNDVIENIKKNLSNIKKLTTNKSSN